MSSGWAGPTLAPGDLQLRSDLQLLNDSGATNIPMTAWPMAVGDVHAALSNIELRSLSDPAKAAYERLKYRLRSEMDTGSFGVRLGLSGAYTPRIIRSFEDTPRDEGEARVELNWLGERFAVNLAATYVANPLDEDGLRPDGTYVGVALGNWMAMAGWQERWWGPGRDGSLILSTNARPMPGITLQRINSHAYKTKWLSWMGPWTFTSFMNLMDDERVVEDGWLFGMRGSFRPTRNLEIGISRTAQWCGDGRPCDLQTFFRVLNGNDNRGANVDPEDEPGNQLGGIDMRWVLPRKIPAALYMQWISEDTRKTGAQLHQWLQQVGIEYWGTIGDVSHRTHFEASSTTSRLGSLGEGSITPNFAFNHEIFKTGYRYRGRSIGHSADGDSLSYSIGSTLVQSAGHSWNVTLRFMEINRFGQPDLRHSLTPTPKELTDLQLSHQRITRFGRISAGLGYSQFDDKLSGITEKDTTGFIQWSSQ